MITLDATTKSLEIDLAASVATNQLPFVVSYVDINQSTFAVTAMAEQDGQSNNTTAVTCLSAPSATTSRILKFLSWKNSDTSSVEGWIQLNNNGTLREIWKGTLASGDTLEFVDSNNFKVLDSTGAIKTAVAQIPQSPLFLAYNSATDTNQTGNGATATVDFDTEVFDVTGNFSADTFTAPVTGKYALQASVRVAALTTAMTQQQVNITTSNGSYTYLDIQAPDASGQKTMTLSVIADMDAGDTALVSCIISNGAGNTASIIGGANRGAGTYFSGVRVG